jgi:hypothetical protein
MVYVGNDKLGAITGRIAHIHVGDPESAGADHFSKSSDAPRTPAI